MKSFHQRRVLFGGAALATLIAAACSNGDDAPLLDAPLDGGAGGAISTVDDASAPQPDADSSAGDGDASDASPKTCSDDDICHTELPPKSYIHDVWSAGDGTAWAVTWSDPQLIASPGYILRWDGSAWSQVFKEPARLHAVWGSSATDIWVGGDSGLFHGTGTSPANLTWAKVRSSPITSIWGTSANDVWAVGATYTWIYAFDGKVLHYSGPPSDGTDGWETDPISSRPLGGLKIWGTSKGDVWLSAVEDNHCAFCTVGTHALVFHRREQDGGMAFVSDGFPEFGDKSSGSLVSAGRSFGSAGVWLAGNLATSFDPSYDVLFQGTTKTDGSGDYAWGQSSFGTCRGNPPCDGLWYTRAIWGSAPNDVYIAGEAGQLRHWDGTKFTYVKTTISKIPTSQNFNAMWGSSSTDLWIVGDQIALHKVAPRNPASAP